MKRTWIALVLFAVVVGLCVYERVFLNKSVEYLTQQIEASQTSAYNSDIEASENQTQLAIDRWHSDHKTLAMFISHDQLETVDQSFAVLMSSLQCDEINDFLIESSRLNEQLKQLKESEILLLHNIF